MNPTNQTNQTPSPTDTGPALKPPVNGIKKFMRNRRNMTIVGVVTVVILALMGFSIWQQSRQSSTQATRPWNDLAPYVPTEVVGKVGEETVYGDDLNYKLYATYPNDRDMTPQEAAGMKDQLFQDVATDSALLQAAQSQGVVKVDQELINNPAKDQLKRALTVQNIRNEIKDNSTNYDYSSISIWFYNMIRPSIPVVQAEQTAKSKMDSIYARLQSGEINMKQAGDLIKADTSLARLDTNYQGNAYSEAKGVAPGTGPTAFEEIDSVALSLEEGQISPIIKIVKTGEAATLNNLPYDSTGELNANEQFYAVIKLEKINQGKYPGLKQWTQQALSQYAPSVAQ